MTAVTVIEKALEKGGATYIVENVDCKAVTVLPGNHSEKEDHLVQV